MKIIAIDPGTSESAVVFYRPDSTLLITPVGIMPNMQTLEMLREECLGDTVVAIEMIASYGMAVGREVFETCVWIGRFIEAWNGPYELVYRKDVKMHLCGTPRAKDANIAQALRDRFGDKGTKKNPGKLYGFKSHLYAALGVAVTAKAANSKPKQEASNA